MSKTLELTVTRIGNSGVLRLPAKVLRRYHIKDSVIMEQRENEIILRPKRVPRAKLSWKETYAQMAKSKEDWSVWDCTIADGLNEL